MRAAAKRAGSAKRQDQVAARLVSTLAYSREQFTNKVEEHIGGALLEFYKAQLGAKNGQTRWVAHWMSEATRLIDYSLLAVLLHSIRGFKDKRRAVDAAIAELRAADAGYRRAAENVVKRDYGLSRLRHRIDDEDTSAFWTMVERTVSAALGE